MQQNIKKRLQRLGKSKRVRIAVVLILFLAVLFLSVFLISKVLGPVTFSTSQRGFREFSAGFSSGAGYPLEIDTRQVTSFATLKKNLVYLSNDALTVLSPNKEQIQARTLQYTDPAMTVGQNKILVYDRKNGNWCLLDQSKIVLEGNLETGLFTATIGNNGSFAFATQSDTAQSALTVLNAKGEPIFSFTCAEERITSVALSSNGKQVAICALGGKDAQLYSRILLFDVRADEPIFTAQYPGDTMLHIQYARNDNFLFVADTKSGIVNAEGVQLFCEYPPGTLQHYSVSENAYTVLALTDLGNKAKATVSFWDAGGEKLWEQEAQQALGVASCDSGRVAVLHDDEIVVYSKAGNVSENIPLQQSANSVLLYRRTIYTVGLQAVHQYQF